MMTDTPAASRPTPPPWRVEISDFDVLIVAGPATAPAVVARLPRLRWGAPPEPPPDAILIVQAVNAHAATAGRLRKLADAADALADALADVAGRGA